MTLHVISIRILCISSQGASLASTEFPDNPVKRRITSILDLSSVNAD